jgi:hypothetical protein
MAGFPVMAHSVAEISSALAFPDYNRRRQEVFSLFDAIETQSSNAIGNLTLRSTAPRNNRPILDSSRFTHDTALE